VSPATGRVVVVGSVNVDLVVASDRLPAPGETIVGGTFRRFHGGKGGNQAVAAARLGARTALVAAVGHDTFGDEARSALAADGVDLDVLRVVEDVPTGVALILVDAAGENLISVAPGANRRLTPGDVEAAFARLGTRRGDVILVTHEIPTGTAREALALGRASGATTVLNPAPADGIDTTLLRVADLLTPNRGELLRILEHVRLSVPDDLAAAARSLLAAGVLGGDGVREAMLVSLGARGALLVSGEDAHELPPLVVGAVDATGAGDALNGALAAGLAHGLPLHEAARQAVIAASLSVTRAGAREGMPTLAQLRAALA